MKTLRKVRAFVGRHYVLKRLLQMIPILFGITLLTFLIMKIAPGSPLQTMINPKLSMEDIQAAEDALDSTTPFMCSISSGWGRFFRAIWVTAL